MLNCSYYDNVHTIHNSFIVVKILTTEPRAAPAHLGGDLIAAWLEFHAGY